MNNATRLSDYLSKPAFVFAALLLAALPLIGSNVYAPFYFFDDSDHLQYATEMPVAELLSLSNGITFMPVSAFSMRLDRILFGPPLSQKIFTERTDEGTGPIDEATFEALRLWPAAARIHSLLLHVLAAFFLWLFLSRIGAEPGLAFFVALSWTVHPMACESICWVSERKNVLAGCLSFAALFVWAGGRDSERGPFSAWRFPVVALLFLAAACSKATAVGFLPVFAALEILNPPDGFKSSAVRQRFPVIALRLITLTLIAAFVIWTGFRSNNTQFVEHAGGSLYHALLTDSEILVRYIGNVLLPINLSFFYGIEPILSLADPKFWICSACVLLTFGSLIALSRGTERRLAVLGTIWFFGAWGPTSNIAALPFWMQDRYIYCSSAGLLLAVGCAVSSLLKRYKFERAAPAAAGLFIAMLLAITVLRAPIFANSDLLMFDAAAKFPKATPAQLQSYTAAMRRVDALASIPGPEAEAARTFFIAKAKTYFDRAVHNHDLTHFKEEFEFRVSHAETLLNLGSLDESMAVLQGFLPPSHLKMRTLNQPFIASEIKEFYFPQTLARAWLVVAKVLLSKTNPPGVSLATLPIAQRFELCDESAAALSKSLAAFNWHDEVPYLLAAVNLTRAELTKLDGHPNEALKFAAAARAQLQSIPKISPSYGSARALLTSLDPR